MGNKYRPRVSVSAVWICRLSGLRKADELPIYSPIYILYLFYPRVAYGFQNEQGIRLYP